MTLVVAWVCIAEDLRRVEPAEEELVTFSKKLENHIGAIWYFIHHYNACLQT